MCCVGDLWCVGWCGDDGGRDGLDVSRCWLAGSTLTLGGEEAFPLWEITAESASGQEVSRHYYSYHLIGKSQQHVMWSEVWSAPKEAKECFT